MFLSISSLTASMSVECMFQKKKNRVLCSLLESHFPTLVQLDRCAPMKKQDLGLQDIDRSCVNVGCMSWKTEQGAGARSHESMVDVQWI